MDNFSIVQPRPNFHVSVSKWQMETLSEIGPAWRESTAAISHRTSCSVTTADIRATVCECMAIKSFCFCY